MDMENIVREGKVTAVNSNKRIAKVWFDTLGIESDWLPMLINGAGMPPVNGRVLVLYFPVFNGDGVILGGIQSWR